MAAEGMTRSELDTLLNRTEDRIEGRQSSDREEILNAIRDLKTSMNGQFQRQGEILGAHETAIKILQDRGSRDNPARWTAVVSGAISLLAAYLGIKV